jgi:AbrB family looped-hinge helix DNA binding protein
MVNYVIVGTSSISEKGQITIPKEIRDKLGIVQGDRLIFDLRGDSIIIKKIGTINLSEILDHQNAWSKSSLEFQKELRDEWE